MSHGALATSYLARAFKRILSRDDETNAVPLTFGASELLGRGVFDSKKAKQAASGKTPPRVFRERDGVKELSVDRLSIADIPVLVSAHDSLRANQVIHGWAELSLDNAGKMNRSVRAAPLRSNPWHAEITLPDVNPLDLSEEQDQHALNLAMLASWRPRPQ